MENIKFYKKNFLTPGIVSYSDIDDGVLLLKKETIDKALNTFKDKPVIITHDGTEPVGKVIDCYYDADTANYICIFYVDNPEAINLLDNQGQSISCTYDCLDYGDSGTYHNIPYDKEAKNISFVNLAIVEKPRYQEAKEYINGLENGGKGSGRKGHKTLKPIKVPTLKKRKDFKQFAKRCFKLYKDNIQGRTVKSLDDKSVYLGRRAADETINKGNPATLTKADKIIETTNFNIEKPSYKKRLDKAISFLVGENKIKEKKKIKDIIVFVRNKKDMNNKITSDLYLITDKKNMKKE